VFTSGVDPVEAGFVASLNRPGGNVTGVAFLVGQLNTKRLELLHELLPRVTMVAVLLDVSIRSAGAIRQDLEKAARSIGLQLQVRPASTESEIDSARAACSGVHSA
jgi:putative ABC transport system substrate-binding protein